jgi:sulfur relay (sulfurtransferase) DsrF/TusC family protein
MSIARLMQMGAAGVPAGIVWTDPDLANASYDSVSFSVAGQETLPTDIFFKPDGTSLYVVGQNSDFVYQYTLSTAWDASSASYASKSFSFASQESNPQGVFFKSDGTKMYAIGFNNTVYQYSLSTAWDVSSASYDAISASTKGQFFSRDVFFKPDGTKFYVIGNGRDAVDQYSLSTAWDISTATDDNVNFSVSTEDGQPQSIYFSPDGANCYVLGADQSTDAVYEYTLSTPWGLTTASYSGVSFSVASQDTAATGLFFKDDGSKMYVVGQSTDTIYQYSTA